MYPIHFSCFSLLFFLFLPISRSVLNSLRFSLCPLVFHFHLVYGTFKTKTIFFSSEEEGENTAATAAVQATEVPWSGEAKVERRERKPKTNESTIANIYTYREKSIRARSWFIVILWSLSRCCRHGRTLLIVAAAAVGFIRQQHQYQCDEMNKQYTLIHPIQQAFAQLSKHKCQNRYKQTLLIIDIILFLHVK